MFLVDSADPERFPEAKKELDSLLSEDYLGQVRFPVFCGQMFLQTALRTSRHTLQTLCFAVQPLFEPLGGEPCIIYCLSAGNLRLHVQRRVVRAACNSNSFAAQ